MGRYIQSSISLVFERKLDLRKFFYEFEKILENDYRTPEYTNIPDEAPAELPRIIFNSKNGNSRISVSQINISLDIGWANDFIFDEEKRIEYLKEKIKLIKRVSSSMANNLHYFGFLNVVNIPKSSIKESICLIASKYLVDVEDNYNDLSLKRTKIIENIYYQNIVVQLYKNWNNQLVNVVQRFSDETISETGVQVVLDFNNRYAYNEDSNYKFKLEEIEDDLIEKVLLILKKEVKKILV